MILASVALKRPQSGSQSLAREVVAFWLLCGVAGLERAKSGGQGFARGVVIYKRAVKKESSQVFLLLVAFVRVALRREFILCACVAVVLLRLVVGGQAVGSRRGRRL